MRLRGNETRSGLETARAILLAALFALTAQSGPKAQSTVDPLSYLPSSFLLDAAEAARGGDVAGLEMFVIWADTPQGAVFWYQEQQRLLRGAALSDGAEAVLVRWIAIAENGLTGPPPPSFDPAVARAALDGDANALLRFVDPSETPQGVVFWQAQAIAAAEYRQITPHARRVLENWLRQSE